MLKLQFRDNRRQPISITGSTLTIGQDESNDLVLTESGISDFHAEIRVEDGNLYLVDLLSGKGTYVNDQPVSKRCRLKAWDLIRITSVELEVVDPVRRRPSDWALKAELDVLSGQFFPIQGTLLVGRGQDCDLIIDDKLLSRQHARLWLEDDELQLEDLQSANGTFVNGVRTERATVQPGDEIRFDSATFRVVGPEVQIVEDDNKTQLRPALDPDATVIQPSPLADSEAAVEGTAICSEDSASGQPPENVAINTERSVSAAAGSGISADGSDVTAEQSASASEGSGLITEDSGSDPEGSGLTAEDSHLAAEDSHLTAENSAPATEGFAASAEGAMVDELPETDKPASTDEDTDEITSIQPVDSCGPQASEYRASTAPGAASAADPAIAASPSPAPSGIESENAPTDPDATAEFGADTVSQQSPESEQTQLLVSPAAFLTGESDPISNERFALEAERCLIGRSHGCAVQLLERSVSGHHAEIYLQDGRWHVRDLNSKNGTYLNDKRVTESSLEDTDLLRMGRVELRFASVVAREAPDNADTLQFTGNRSSAPRRSAGLIGVIAALLVVAVVLAVMMTGG